MPPLDAVVATPAGVVVVDVVGGVPSVDTPTVVSRAAATVAVALASDDETMKPFAARPARLALPPIIRPIEPGRCGAYPTGV